MGFDQHLQIFFNGCSFARQFLYFPATEAEKLDIAQGSLLNFLRTIIRYVKRDKSGNRAFGGEICYKPDSR
ncbi:hypothetical protein CBI63_09935 [Salmonella enterica]|nr:hypothetical protein CBI63_09935 [Salmonella enterica]